MPLRPSLLLRPIARISSPWTCPSCVSRTGGPPLLRHPQASQFHRTAIFRADNAPNHYETLQLPSSASASDIKRQFYTLSKEHHPDRNQNDPTASTRFVAISEAYHVLSVPEKRAQYDATLQSHSSGSGRPGSANYPQGSYSSASFGSRPASGLNKKRSTFRGPPPSFYKAGGYGEQGAKRAEYAYQHAQDGQEAGPESYGDFGGFGPGQQKQGNEVPHFDDRRHRAMHDNVYQHIWARRRRTQRAPGAERDYARGNMLLDFIVVSGIIGVIGVTLKVFGDQGVQQHNVKRKDAP